MSDIYYQFVRITDGTPRLGHGDNRPVRVGETLTVETAPAAFELGMHTSRLVMNALCYGPSAERLALCRVTLGGEVVWAYGTGTASERTVIAMLEPERTDAMLREFACWCALSVAHLWTMPPVVRQYLETGDEMLSYDALRAGGELEETLAGRRCLARDWARQAARRAVLCGQDRLLRAVRMTTVAGCAWLAGMDAAAAQAHQAQMAARRKTERQLYEAAWAAAHATLEAKLVEMIDAALAAQAAEAMVAV